MTIFPYVLFSQETTGESPSYLDNVEIEEDPNTSIQKSCECNYTYFSGYGKRRGSWGYTLGFAYSAYQPVDYQPDFVTDKKLEEVYGSPEIPHIEISFGIKKNMSVGSFGMEISGGFYRNTAGSDMSLNLIPVRAGLTLAFDKLFSEPLFVPYASGGGYSVIYQEKNSGQSVKGTSKFGLYGVAGLLIQLDWIDPSTAVEAFVENGMVASYAFAEARYMNFVDEKADFSAPIQWAAGMKIEF